MALRTRTRLDNHLEQFTAYVAGNMLDPPNNDPLPYSDLPPRFSIEAGFPISSTQYTSSAFMQDVAKGRGVNNPCVHYNDWIERVTWLRHGNSADRNLRDGPSTGAYQHMWHNPLGFVGEESLTRGLLPDYPADLSFPDLSGDALRAMWPEVETEVSLLNFVYELKDLKTLPETIKSLKRIFGFLVGRGKGNSLIKDVSDVYLQQEFGIKPLYGDVRAIISGAQSLETEFRKYFSDQNKVLRRHFTRRYVPDSVPWSLSREFSTPHGSPTTHRGKHTCGVPEVTYTATMVYSYSLPSLGPLDGHALRDIQRDLFAMDLFGVQLNPKIVWEAIPFSFLVDYFLRVGDWLDQFKKRNLEPEVVIWDWIESIRYTVKRHHWVLPFNYGPNTWCYCGSMNREVYKRRLHVPDTYESLQANGLTGRQIINMCALVGARAKARKAASTH